MELRFWLGTLVAEVVHRLLETRFLLRQLVTIAAVVSEGVHALRFAGWLQEGLRLLGAFALLVEGAEHPVILFLLFRFNFICVLCGDLGLHELVLLVFDSELLLRVLAVGGLRALSRAHQPLVEVLALADAHHLLLESEVGLGYDRPASVGGFVHGAADIRADRLLVRLLNLNF